MKLYIAPKFNSGQEGGIKRVVEAQIKWLPEYGITLVDTPQEADLIAGHAGNYIRLAKEIPFVSHIHGLYWSEYQWGRGHAQVNKQVIEAMHNAVAITSPSKWVADIITRGFWTAPTVIPNGVEPSEWVVNTKNPGDYILWNKTRIDPVCTIDEVNELARMFHRKQFVSTLGNEITNKRPNVQLSGRLTYRQAKEYVQNAGVYLATTREVCSIGVLEAMASGVPILGWNWGGQREQLIHLKHGWLAPPGNYDSLAEGLVYCLNNRELLGEAARQYVINNFSWQYLMAQYAILYNAVLLPKPKTPKVSIIMPCYNLSTYIEEAIVSVLNQTEYDWELIIVDDASTDDSLSIMRKFAVKDKRIIIKSHELNTGVSSALNTGIAVASGSYIMALDADNMLTKNALSILSSALDSDRSLDIVYGSMELLNDYTKERKPFNWPRQFNLDNQFKPQNNEIPSTCLCRREVFTRTGGYRERYTGVEDADMWCRAISIGFKPAKVTDEVTFIYRQRPDSLSHTKPKGQEWTSWYPNYKKIPAVTYESGTYEPALISIIIPVGPGHEKLVIDAIDSVYAQTFNKWRVIVVNDTGKPLPWIQPFVTVLSTHKAGRGVAVARNIGIAASSTKLFLPLDADDFLKPTALEKLYDAYTKYNGSYVYCDWLDETGTLHEMKDYDPKLITHEMFHPVTALYTRAMWTKVKGFDETLNAWEDWDFQLALCNAGYCGIRYPEPLFTYRMNTGTERNRQYANREAGKANIYKKWQLYIDGGEQMAGCTTCGGAPRRAAIKPQPPETMEATLAQINMVKLEYIIEGMGPTTWRGKVTNTMYRFGSDPVNRIKYVYEQDAAGLLAHADKFRQIDGIKVEFTDTAPELKRQSPEPTIGDHDIPPVSEEMKKQVLAAV